jgi:hypothetical protein
MLFQVRRCGGIGWLAPSVSWRDQPKLTALLPDSGRSALRSTRPKNPGLLTVLMRRVFVRYAADRNLIPSKTDKDARWLYEQSYSVRGLFARLSEDEALNRSRPCRHDAYRGQGRGRDRRQGRNPPSGRPRWGFMGTHRSRVCCPDSWQAAFRRA